MKPRPPLPPGPYLVVGLARSGVAAARALRAAGHEVIAVDAQPDPAAAAELRADGFAVYTGTSGLEHLEHVAAVVKSPGVPAEAEVIAAARERGITVTGELEIAWRLIPNEFIAVTGTNGKTTTVELVGHIHREAGLAVCVVGNVGTAASTVAGRVSPNAVVVCETSSFQLEDARAFAPEVAVLLNITPEHLDRHGTFEEYTAAKLRIFAAQGNDDVAVVPAHLGEAIGGCARRVLFGTGPEAELAERAGHLWWADEPLLAVEDIRLRGAHNHLNAMAAAGACLARGVDVDAVRAGLRSFAGVEHRLEEVGRHDGVLYVNDSKATNVDSTLVALASFDAPVHVILGGRGGEQDFTALREAVRGRAASVELIGESAERLDAALEGIPAPRHRCGDLQRAVARARELASPGDVVLLSPACKSFDQYTDFETRGAHFKALVSELG
jgi:UDP-N-acetylmuramoylalanine--D-glutamate ligase